MIVVGAMTSGGTSASEVPEAELYEFSVDGGEVSTTRNRTVILSKLDKGRTYSFSVRAMTSDATRFSHRRATCSFPFFT